jgi:hypothetical protein
LFSPVVSMQYSPWLQLKSMAGRMVGELTARALHAVRAPQQRRPLAAEPTPEFGDTQPMCFETRRPEPVVRPRARVG